MPPQRRTNYLLISAQLYTHLHFFLPSLPALPPTPPSLPHSPLPSHSSPPDERRAKLRRSCRAGPVSVGPPAAMCPLIPHRLAAHLAPPRATFINQPLTSARAQRASRPTARTDTPFHPLLLRPADLCTATLCFLSFFFLSYLLLLYLINLLLLVSLLPLFVQTLPAWLVCSDSAPVSTLLIRRRQTAIVIDTIKAKLRLGKIKGAELKWRPFEN